MKTSPHLLVSLIKTFCIPIILYSLVAVTTNNKIKKTINTALSLAFSKIFSTYDKSVIDQCQFYLGVLPLNYQLDMNKISFLSKMSKCNNYHLLTLFNIFGNVELQELYHSYSVSSVDKHYTIKSKITTIFKNKCGL